MEGGAVLRKFEIVDGSRRSAHPCAVLLWDEARGALAVEICEDAQEQDVPMLFASFVRKGERKLGDDWARRWIAERVVPVDRQNLGQVLKANSMRFYDEMRLFVNAEGRCSQDDFFIREVSVEGEGTQREGFNAGEQVAAILVAARREAGLSQIELAQRCGLRQSAISRLESGKANPTVDMVAAVAEGLGKQLVLELR